MTYCQSPIYLHSSWRSGSTYVWAKLRGRPDTCCFFEPLNEHLADATPDFIDRFQPWEYANHPALETPYLEEYRPLLRPGGGIGDFPVSLSWEKFRADRADSLPELEQWFSLLRRFAAATGKRPVFGCVRTDLRLDWCRHHLDGCHIALIRDPRERFLSCLRQAVKGNRYFLERPWVVLGLNRNDPAFVPLALHAGIPAFDGSLLEKIHFLERNAWVTDWTRLYVAFYGLHLIATAQLTSAHYLIDLGRVSDDLAARAETETEVERLTGVRLSFDDCHVSRYAPELSWSSRHFRDLEAEVASVLKVSASLEPLLN